MKIQILSFMILAVALIGLLCYACCAAWQSWQSRHLRLFSNIGAGIHKNAVTRTADAVLAFVNTGADAAGYLLKEGVTAGSTIALIAAASDKPAFIALDGADAIADPVACGLLNASNITRKMIAKVAIAAGVGVYSYGDGKVTVEPTAAGTYWKVGESRTASAADGDVIEVETILPEKVVVVAALASVQNATTAAVDLATSEALANALKANYNTLQADVAALYAGLAHPAKVIPATT